MKGILTIFMTKKCLLLSDTAGTPMAASNVARYHDYLLGVPDADPQFLADWLREVPDHLASVVYCRGTWRWR